MHRNSTIPLHCTNMVMGRDDGAGLETWPSRGLGTARDPAGGLTQLTHPCVPLFYGSKPPPWLYHSPPGTPASWTFMDQ